jgi:Protein of unknown function (DUF3810)
MSVSSSQFMTRPLYLIKYCYGFARRRLSRRSVIKISIIILALALALIPVPSTLVERFYSNGLYPILQSMSTPVANQIPFAVVDLLIALLLIGLPAWWIVRIIKAGRGRRKKVAARLAFHTLVLTAVIFIGFQLLWGFNYERESLAAKLDYDEQRLTADALRQLRRISIERLNAESTEAHYGQAIDEKIWRDHLHSSFDETVIELGNSRGITAAIPKTSLLNFYLTAAGIEGFINPFGHEVILDSEIFTFEKPFLLAHEWAHLAGFADESEASFVALLACLRSDVAVLRYSALLALYQYTPRIAPAAPEEVKAAMSMDALPRLVPEVIADLKAISERDDRHRNATISRVQWAVYDRFLKANRVRAGVGSYSRFVRLVLGTRFEPDWTPVRRAGP